jgi:excisionase family DNA binding protein
MTGPAALARRPVETTEEERPTLERLDQLIRRREARTAKLVGPDGVEIELPESAFCALRQAIHHLVRAQAVMLVPIDQKLTTHQAAKLLNVSRPYLIQLLDEGKIAHTRTGSHRRIRFEDAMAYKDRRDAQRRQTLRELTRASREMGLFDKE